jgi:hypothetical protein
MDIDFAQYEKDCERIRNENEKLLQGFAKHLNKSGIKEKTTRKHCLNIDSFLDYFLLYEEAVSAAKGIDMIGEYLGDFYIRKCMWSSPAQTKLTITSFKKFYAYLSTIGKVTPENLKEMNVRIKAFSADWIEAVRIYNDTDDEWF